MKPVWYSTVGYMSADWADYRLKELCSARKIDDYYVAPHRGELKDFGTDGQKEERDKDHLHIAVRVCSTLADLEVIRSHLDQSVGEGKPPLGALPFNACKSLDDWLLYSYHDSEYLAFKGEVREFTYEPDILLCRFPDFLERNLSTAKTNVLGSNKSVAVYDALMNGERTREILRKYGSCEAYRVIGLSSKSVQEHYAAEVEKWKSLCLKVCELANLEVVTDDKGHLEVYYKGTDDCPFDD